MREHPQVDFLITTNMAMIRTTSSVITEVFLVEAEAIF